MFKRHRQRTTAASDSDLAIAACRGNADAIEELYDRHGAMVYRFTLRMSGNHLIAEEVTQEVFLAFLRQPHQFQAEKGAFSTWLCGIARRQLWKRLEREETFVEIDSFEEQMDQESPLGPYDLLNRKDAVNAVRAGIEQLPLWLKEVIVLCELEELTYVQVSFILGVPVGTVRSRLHRAKARLAALLCAEAPCALEEKLS